MVVRLRVSDVDGSTATFDQDLQVSATSTVPDLLALFNRYASWGDAQSAGQYAAAIALSTQLNASSASVVEKVLLPLYTSSEAGQLGPNSIPTLLSTVSLICRVPEAVSNQSAATATRLLDYAVSVVERDSTISLFTATTSRLSRVVTSSMLQAGANVARALSSNQATSTSTRNELVNIISRLVALQTRSSAEFEASASVSSLFLNVTSEILAAAAASFSFTTNAGGMPLVIGISNPQLNNVTLQTISWAAASFPFVANFSSNTVITEIVQGGEIVSINVVFSGITAEVEDVVTCGRFDDGNKRWTSVGCTTASQGPGSYMCTCTIPQSSPTSRVSMAMLIGSSPDGPGAPGRAAVAPGAPLDPGALAAGALSAGAIVGIVFACVVVAAVVIGAAIWYRRKKQLESSKTYAMERMTKAIKEDAGGAKKDPPPSAAVPTRSGWSKARPQSAVLKNEISPGEDQ